MGSKPLKYADKSAGQPELLDLFNTLKKILSDYAKGNFFVKTNQPGAFEIYYGKEVVHGGKKYPELLFASLLIQKGYLGFYFFPVYLHHALLEKIKPDLTKTLKGKTCFHLKKANPETIIQIQEALETGYRYYASRGWK